MTALKLSLPDPGPNPAHNPADSRQLVTAFLDALGASLRANDSRRRDVVDEIAGHIDDRVRDLMVAGQSESDATRRSLEELGDPRELAARCSAALSTPRRRRIMHTTLVGLAATALIGGAIALHQDGSPRKLSAFQPPAEQSALGDVRIVANEETSWSDLFNSAGKSARLPVYVHWSQLRVYESIKPESGIGVSLTAGFSLDRSLQIINDTLNLSQEDGIAYRVQDGNLVFSSVAYFDQTEIVMATFDLAGVPGVDGGEEVVQLLTSMVHPEIWQANGGDRAAASVFAGTLFIRAPKRILPEVQWVMDEIRKSLSAKHAAVPILSDVPIVGGGSNAATAASRMHVVALKHTDAASVKSVLARAYEANPMLGADSRRPSFTVDSAQNSIVVGGAAQQVDLVERVIGLIDRPAPQEVAGTQDVLVISVHNVRAGALRDVLGRAFNACPAVKQCAVPRVLESDDSEGRISITATREQNAWASELASLIDPAPLGK